MANMEFKKNVYIIASRHPSKHEGHFVCSRPRALTSKLDDAFFFDSEKQAIYSLNNKDYYNDPYEFLIAEVEIIYRLKDVKLSLDSKTYGI